MTCGLTCTNSSLLCSTSHHHCSCHRSRGNASKQTLNNRAFILEGVFWGIALNLYYLLLWF